jgi:signal recognition particle subunit SRP54
VRKLGPIGNLLGMLPGAAQNREALSQVSDKDLDRAAAIVNSMTPGERRNPKIINGSRRARIAGGSGVTVGEVNQLIVRFLEGQKMMRQMMGMPGMRRAGQKARGKAKKRGKAGRPGGHQGARQGSIPAGGSRAGADQGGGQPGLPDGRGAGIPAGLPDGLGGGAFRLPPGLQSQQPNLPPGFRGRPGKKGR